MKTIRVTGIALSIAALLLVAMAPQASAACPAGGGVNAAKLKGTYVFRLAPAKSFAADLANQGDPGAVTTAVRQNVMKVGVFTADGAGNITALGHTLATLDSNAGCTLKVDFTWTGTYTVNADNTGTLCIAPAAIGTWTCTDETGTAACIALATCAATDEVQEAYSISVSATYGRVELSETDNAGGGATGTGTKIFMVGEALKR